MSENKERIMRVMEDSPNRWQTARGIAVETGISLEEVTRILNRSPEIIRAKKGNRHGEALYARKEKLPKHVSDDLYEEQETMEVDRPSERLNYLVLLPLDASLKRLRDSIGTVVREEQGEPLFLDEIKPGALWVDEVAQMIRLSHAVIADISRRNPNLMFELGMAHSLGKPMVLLLSETADTNVPANLAGFQYLTYLPENLSSFMDRLRKTLRQITQRLGEH